MNVGQAYSDVQNNCSSSDDSLKRQDMFIDGIWKLGSAIPAINNLQYIGKSHNDHWLVQLFKQATNNSDPFYTQTDIYKFISKLNKLRLSCDTLNNGNINIKF